MKLIRYVKIMSVQFDSTHVCSVFAASSNQESWGINLTFYDR